MKKLFTASSIYMLAGVLSGLFYREFTKFNDFPAGEFTQLGLAHTHLLTLGFIILLIVMIIEKVFNISRNKKMFNWFFWLYNAGVAVTSAMLILHGSLTVVGRESNDAIAGVAGLGHMLIAAGMILFLLLLRRALKNQPEEAVHSVTV